MISTLRSTGLAKLAPIQLKYIAEANEFLLSRPVFVDAHVPQTARARGEGPTARNLAFASECICVHNHDALLAPHLFENVLGTVEVAAAYLGVETPFLYSANAFWTRPGNAAARDDIQSFHRDQDDSKFLAVFTYLTDVMDRGDGPHELEGPDRKMRLITGHRGTVFLADTSYRHRGLKPLSGERGIHWFRWCVSERPVAYGWDGTEPIAAELLGDRYPADPRLRLAISPLVSTPN